VTVGVLAMAYGTPRDRDDIAAYYTDIRRGRAPSAEQLADLVARYDAIGGTFPLRQITADQCAALQRALGDEFVVALGQKHAAPFVEDGLDVLAGKRVSSVVGLVLAPHYSAMSVGEYARRAADAGARHGLHVSTVAQWHLLPAYVEFLSTAVRTALAELPADSEVIFTAHSLPARIVESGDPYPQQLAETAGAVASASGLTRWSTAWQSAGRTPEPWLGPDVLDVVRDRAARDVAGVVVCACGFTADHLEVAYDLDIEAARVAAELQLPFARTASINADAKVFAALADLVRDHAAGQVSA
jgi:ferrochelatase